MPRAAPLQASLVVNLLGGFSVSRAGHAVPLSFKRRKTLALFGYLAATPDRAHTRSKLAALLWGELGEAEARHALRQSVLELRTALARLGLDALQVESESRRSRRSARPTPRRCRGGTGWRVRDGSGWARKTGVP